MAPVPVTKADSSAVGKMISSLFQSVYRFTIAPQRTATSQVPVRTEVLRFRVLMGETRNVSLPVQVNSIIVVSPEIALAVLNGQALTLTGLHVGETMVIGLAGPLRFTFLVQVVGRTRSITAGSVLAPNNALISPNAISGTYVVSFTAPLAGAPAQLSQTFELQKKLTGGRTFRFSSDMFKSRGGDGFRQSGLSGFGVGVNRMSMGIDGPDGSVDILDSQINISPLSFNGYMMRGLHIISSDKSALRGAEIFVGMARPSLSMFDLNRGRVFGIIAPLAQGKLWRVRAGIFSVAPAAEKGLKGNLGSGGTVLHLDGRYAPDPRLAVEGEASYANGGLSWRAQLNLQLRNLTASGEILRFDQRSPLVSVGAQTGGRAAESLAVQWRPSGRLNTSFSYNHTTIVPPASALRATLDRTTFSAHANYRLTTNSRLGLRFVQQRIETGAASGGPRFRLENRTLSVSHDIRFNKNWTNSLTARFNSSREPLANTGTERGVTVNEQLRLAFKKGSVVGFVNYVHQEQSLAGLIVRSPRLLPPLLQEAFAADPSRFLLENRDTLNTILPGVELPQTRGLDAGIRLQNAFSRVTLQGEVRYSANEILARSQRRIVTSVNFNLRLDAANSVQLRSSRSFNANGAAGQSSLVFSYVHRFGAGSGGGLQFSRMLGFERGVIQGRVFIDLNANGNDEPEEPGVAGMKVQIGSDRSATTDDGGRFRFQTNSGEYKVVLISEELGVRWRANTPTEQHGFLQARQTVTVNFGVSNYGSVAGRVFNDVLHSGEQKAGLLFGVAGVSLRLSPINMAGSARSVIADGSGAYQFPYLPPGSYTLEIDRSSLPPDFHTPAQTSWVITVKPLANFYLDLPLSAQRAVSGVVFIDKDGDGKFDPEKDEPVEGARVISDKTEATSGKRGTYVLRNLPAGRIIVHTLDLGGTEGNSVTLELTDGPIRRSGVNLAIKR